jgi:hypothetical protein
MGIIDTVKDVAALVQKADNIELHQKIIELQGQIMSLLEETHGLRAQRQQLLDRLQFAEGLEFRNNMYWSRRDGCEEGPYCTKCWDADQKKMRLQQLLNGAQYCPNCQQSAPGTFTSKSGTHRLDRGF